MSSIYVPRIMGVLSSVTIVAVLILLNASRGAGPGLVSGAAQEDRGAARQATQPRQGSPSDASQPEPHHPLKRGEYIVKYVAMCVECHSPRDAHGTINTDRLFEGAPIPVRSPWPKQTWAFYAPHLAGLPSGWSEPELVEFLVTGLDRRGRPRNAPMPAFRMTREDATAVAAYLRSLSGAPRSAVDTQSPR